MRSVSTILAIAAAMALASCGSAGDPADDLFAEIEASLAETAYLPSYQRCVIRKAEELVPPAKIRRLLELSPEQAGEAGFELILPAAVKCQEETKGPIVDPNATAAELAPIRDRSARAYGRVVLKEGATRTQARCVERAFNAMSNAELIEFANATTAAQEKQFLPAIKSCFVE